MVWVINDDIPTLETIMEMLTQEFFQRRFLGFKCLEDAEQSGTSPEFILLDIGAISLESNADVEDLMHPILNKYTYPTLFLYSALQSHAQGIAEEYREKGYAVNWIDIINYDKHEQVLETLKAYGM